jgi:PAS domain S-box-containing protein
MSDQTVSFKSSQEDKDLEQKCFDLAGMMMVVIDNNQTITLVNKKTCEILGYAKEEILGKNWFDNFLPEDIRDKTKAVFKNLLNGAIQDNENAVNEVMTKYGKRRLISWHNALIQDMDGNITEILSSGEDITARKEAEIALKRSEENYRSIFENTKFGVFRSSMEGQYLSVNPAMAKMFGYLSPEDMIESIADIAQQSYVNPADRERFVKLFESEVYAFETQRYRKDKTRFWVSTNTRPIKDETGKILCYEGIMEDITERKTAEDRIEANRVSLQQKNIELEKAYAELKSAQSQILQQEKMASIGQLAAGIAHEINNPVGFIMSNLNSLQKYTERLAQFVDLQSQALEAVSVNDSNVGALLKNICDKRQTLKIDYIIGDLGNIIKESLEGAERVKRIVQDLKSFSRIDDAEYKMDDLNGGLESTINIVWNELKYKATVKKEYGDIPRTKCNLGQINQVFMNLLVNAAQSIKEKGDILVKTAGDNGMIHVTIADTGCGIEPDSLNRIFEPFYTTKEIGKGTGLGLSIAYDIIKKHNGNIAVTSEVGKGTSFTISIPIVDE